MMAISLPFPVRRNLWRSKDFHRMASVSHTLPCPFMGWECPSTGHLRVLIN